MSREDYLARTIDRKREASSTKAARSARQMFVRMLARQRLTAGVPRPDRPGAPAHLTWVR